MLKTTTSKIQFDSSLEKENVDAFIAAHIIDSNVTNSEMNNSLTTGTESELEALKTSLEGSNKTQQIASDQFLVFSALQKLRR